MDRIDAAILEEAVEAARKDGIDADAQRLLEWAWDLLGDRLMMSTAFGKSGLCILHMIKEIAPEMPVYFLETGFHFQESLDFFDQLKTEWGVNLEKQYPNLRKTEFVDKYGATLYESNPGLCCQLNKVEPMRALWGDESGRYQGWIAGVRRDQSSTRAQAEGIEMMENNLIKIQPLAHWTRDRVEDYLKENKIPLHPLFERGYPSVGCEPCTQPASDPGDERSGRWAGQAKTECGLHTFWQKKGITPNPAPEEEKKDEEPETNDEPESDGDAESRPNGDTEPDEKAESDCSRSDTEAGSST